MTPLLVLSVCMGNICRSPMAERLLMHAVRERVGDSASELIVSESTGTGSWHAGEPMNPPASRELRRRGVSADGFRARKLAGSHLDTADLILTATSEQVDFALGLRPDAADRTFVLGEFGRLATHIDAGSLPPFSLTPLDVHARGVALITAVDVARDGARPRAADDLDDPWGRGDAHFRATADQIVWSLRPIVDLLFPLS
jgi:low molecular weight protein-tyrosine phosphatase